MAPPGRRKIAVVLKSRHTPLHLREGLRLTGRQGFYEFISCERTRRTINGKSWAHAIPHSVRPFLRIWDSHANVVMRCEHRNRNPDLIFPL
jgi:hypothetical protein